jgi:hypothetical protein
VPNVMGGVSVSDNCSGASAITLSQSPAAGTLVGIGTHTITVTATDAAGNSATCTTIFTVEGATAAASGPINLVRFPEQSASFSTLASGTGPFTYQWRKDGANIGGATNLSYSIASLRATNAGTYCVVVTGTCSSVTNCATLTVLDECLPLNSDTPKINWQTTVFEQKVWITNSTDATFSAVRIFIRGMRDGVWVNNASGDEDGVVFVQYDQELRPGEVANLTIEYFVANRQTPESELCAKPVVKSSPVQQDGTAVKIDRMIWLADGSLMIEFSALPGQVYYIQYSADLRDWTTVTPGGTSGPNRIQWIDNGPPKTDSLPNRERGRFYRVVTP